uniref:Uncharacterized protein n=1 Tax=Anguilla anguilla TaxID=7936 RepID=A0A0E9T4V0_ANGAN
MNNITKSLKSNCSLLIYQKRTEMPHISSTMEPAKGPKSSDGRVAS